MIDSGRYVMAIGARAAEERSRTGRPVLGRQGAQRPLDLQLALVQGQVDRPVQPRGGGRVDEQGLDVRRADNGQHLGPVVRRQGQIAHAQSVSR